MRKIFLVLLATMSLTMAVAQSRIATVDRKAVLHSLPEYANAEAELQLLSDAYQKEYAAMQADFNSKYAEFQSLSNDASTPATIKQRRIKEIQESDKKIADFRRATEDDMRQRRDALVAPLNTAVDAAIASVAQDADIDLVLDVSTTPVAYAGANVTDITATVIESLK